MTSTHVINEIVYAYNLTFVCRLRIWTRSVYCRLLINSPGPTLDNVNSCVTRLIFNSATSLRLIGVPQCSFRSAGKQAQWLRFFSEHVVSSCLFWIKIWLFNLQITALNINYGQQGCGPAPCCIDCLSTLPEIYGSKQILTFQAHLLSFSCLTDCTFSGSLPALMKLPPHSLLAGFLSFLW